MPLNLRETPPWHDSEPQPQLHARAMPCGGGRKACRRGRGQLWHIGKPANRQGTTPRQFPSFCRYKREASVCGNRPRSEVACGPGVGLLRPRKGPSRSEGAQAGRVTKASCRRRHTAVQIRRGPEPQAPAAGCMCWSHVYMYAPCGLSM